MGMSNTNQQLEALAKDFYQLFHVLLSIYDGDKNLIVSYPSTMCDFCALVRQDEELHRRCLTHDRNALDRCDRTLAPYTYHCHMGLVETAEPIVKDGVVLGYLLFGQLTDDRENALSREVIRSLDTSLDRRKLLAALKKVSYCAPEYIRAMSRMLVMCAAYIQGKDMLSWKTDDAADALTAYIQQHIDSKITCDELCARFNMSRTALYTLSKRCFGKSISAYITSIRMNMAKKMLHSKDCAISSAAYAVGFEDNNYFSKVFRRSVGMSPMAYRRAHGE